MIPFCGVVDEMGVMARQTQTRGDRPWTPPHPKGVPTLRSLYTRDEWKSSGKFPFHNVVKQKGVLYRQSTVIAIFKYHFIF